MVTIQAFNDAAKRCSKCQALWSAVGVFQLLGVMGLLGLARENRADLLVDAVALPFVVAGAMFTSFLVLLFCILKTGRIDRAFPELACPHCDAELGLGCRRLIVVATRNCTNCGRRVLAEPAA